ncbi:MAG: acyl carrier protein [Pseudomonadota bacterium]
MPDIGERVSSVLATRLHVRPDQLTEAATFGDLAATSLDLVETVMSLEDEFEIEISDREAEKLHTVGDVMALVRQKVH